MIPKFIYVAPGKLPSTSANSIHVTEMSKALNENNQSVLVLYPFSKSRNKSSIHDIYNIEESVTFMQAPVLTSFFARKWLYAIWVLRVSIAHKESKILSRDFLSSYLLTIFNSNIIHEFHNDIQPVSRLSQLAKIHFLSKLKDKKVIAITQSLQQDLSQKYSLENVIVMPDASSLRPETYELKSRVEKIGYIGSFYPGKGVEIVVSIAQKLPMYEFVLIGGNRRQLIELTKVSTPDNITLKPHVPYGRIREEIMQCDICLLPNQKRVNDISGRNIGDYTSPLKLFDYMACARPIVASDLPVLREIINSRNAVLCKHDNIEEWCNAIVSLDRNLFLRQGIAREALQYARANTWSQRVKKILPLYD